MDILDASNAAYALHVEASALRLQGKNEEAAEKWASCVGLIPDEPSYLREYADCLARLQRYEDGLAASSLAASLDPYSGETWALMAGAYGNLGEQENFIDCLNRADRLAPNSPSVLWNRSLYYLLHGLYADGWRDYEWRAVSNTRRRTLKDAWNGSAAANQDGILFIWAEQGFGDTLQFIRFVKLAKERWGGRVTVEVQRELVTLLHGRGAELGFDEIVTPNVGGSIPYEDFEHVSLMSLPYVLGIDDEDKFWTGPYLSPQPPLLQKGGVGEAQRMKVGVCWRGSTSHSADDVRSIDDKAFFDAVIAGRNGYDFYSINPSARLPDLPHCLNPDLGSFAETARVIAGLDLVITVDTSVAHLAGAMGKPVWLLLRYATDFRWCLNHPTSTPWYPSARLFRQPALRDWATPLAAVKEALDAH